MTSEFVIVTWQLRVTLVDSIHNSCDVLQKISAEGSLQVPGDNQRRCGKERSCTCTSLIKYSDSNSSWILKVEIKWGSTVNTVELFISTQQVLCPMFYNFYLTFSIFLKIEILSWQSNAHTYHPTAAAFAFKHSQFPFQYQSFRLNIQRKVPVTSDQTRPDQ